MYYTEFSLDLSRHTAFRNGRIMVEIYNKGHSHARAKLACIFWKFTTTRQSVRSNVLRAITRWRTQYPTCNLGSLLGQNFKGKSSKHRIGQNYVQSRSIRNTQIMFDQRRTLGDCSKDHRWESPVCSEVWKKAKTKYEALARDDDPMQVNAQALRASSKPGKRHAVTPYGH